MGKGHSGARSAAWHAVLTETVLESLGRVFSWWGRSVGEDWSDRRERQARIRQGGHLRKKQKVVSFRQACVKGVGCNCYGHR